MSNVLLLNTSVSKAEEKSKNFKKLKSRPKKRNKLNISSIPFFPKKTYKNNLNPEKIEKIKPEQNPPNNSEPIITNNNTESEMHKENNNDINTYAYTYDYEYIKNFQNFEKSKDTDLLSVDVLEHINQIEEDIKLIKMEHYLDNKICKNSFYSNCNTSKSSSSSLSNINPLSLEIWARPDYTKENEEAENNKKVFDELSKKDVIKKELREILNSMTKDNYEEKKLKILELIKDKIENQNKFLEIIFLKSILEKSYVILYAKLCKDLNKELPQKSETRKTSSIFRQNLLEKCKEMLKFEEKINFDEYVKEADEQEKNNKIKKIILGNALFISELVNIKMLSKKAAYECIDYLFKRFNENKNNDIKLINIQAIIIFIDKLGTLIHKEKEKEKEKNSKIKKEKNNQKNFDKMLDEAFAKLEKIKEDPAIPGHVRYSIINLIDKKNNNYKQSEFEKYITAKSKKEIEEEAKEIKNIQKKEKDIILSEKEEINQEQINEKIEKDLYGYKDIIINEGSSDNYLWSITTDLYDVKLKGFDDILEGFIVSSAFFIEKKENIFYAKSYINELIVYYGSKMEENEKKDLINKVIYLFELIKDFAFETPDIFEIYEYVIYLFIKNRVFNMKDLEKIFAAKENSKEKEDVNIMSKVFQNIFNLMVQDDEIELKNEFKELHFINKYKDLFYVS